MLGGGGMKRCTIPLVDQQHVMLVPLHRATRTSIDFYPPVAKQSLVQPLVSRKRAHQTEHTHSRIHTPEVSQAACQRLVALQQVFVRHRALSEHAALCHPPPASQQDTIE